MERINTPARAQDLFGPGRDGFTNGNPQSGIASTQLDAEWFNAVQEEIAQAIELAGIVLAPPDPTYPQYHQLFDAIRAIAIANNPDLSGYLPLVGGILAGPGNLIVGGNFRVDGAAQVNQEVQIITSGPPGGAILGVGGGVGIYGTGSQIGMWLTNNGLSFVIQPNVAGDFVLTQGAPPYNQWVRFAYPTGQALFTSHLECAIDRSNPNNSLVS